MKNMILETMVMLIEVYEAYEDMKDKLISIIGIDISGERNVFGKLDRLEEVIYNLSDPELLISRLDDYPCMAYYILNDKNMDTNNKAKALLNGIK